MRFKDKDANKAGKPVGRTLFSSCNYFHQKFKGTGFMFIYREILRKRKRENKK